MTNIINLLPKILLLSLSLLLFSCHVHHEHDDHHHEHIDERYFFLGTYHVIETFYNPNSGGYESFEYDLEITEVGSGLQIAVAGYGNGGIYGTQCALVGSVYGGTHIDIPLNVCNFSNNTTFEIAGHGDLSNDGQYITFDLDIIRCDNGHCHDEPEVTISGHRI